MGIFVCFIRAFSFRGVGYVLTRFSKCLLIYFVGMGAENNANAFYSVLFAVLAHKCLEAFALGLSIYYAKFSLLATCLMIIGYSLATPAGVAIGVSNNKLPKHILYIFRDWYR